MKLISIIFLILFPAIQVFAQTDENPANWCRNGLFPRENVDFSLAKIKAKRGERVYFYSDDENCPSGKKCQTKSYLLANNEVIVSRKFGNFACSWYQGKKGETVGWITLDKLEFQNLLQSTDEYLGKWSFYDNSIEIKKTDKANIFNVTGNAFWKGFGDNIHIGELEGEAENIDGKLKYGEKDTGEYDCKATLDLIGKYLIVSDNLNCGGANVSFSGVYLKR